VSKTEDTQSIEGLKPAVSLFEERWNIFKLNRLAYSSFIFLIFLFALALLGKVLTRWIVMFDPQLVRLPEKFLPPLTPFTSKIVSAEDAPMFNIYFIK